MRKIKLNSSVLTFLFGQGVLFSIFKTIKNKLFKKDLTPENVEKINKDLSDFVESTYEYFDGKTKRGFEGLSKIKGIESKLEFFFEPNDKIKYPYFDKAKEKIQTNILLSEKSYIGNYIVAITEEVEFFRDKHIVPRSYDKSNKLTTVAYDENGNDVTAMFPQTESKGVLEFANSDIWEIGVNGTEKYNQYEKELNENIENLKKLIMDYKKKHKQ